jgi:hypothetical protein
VTPYSFALTCPTCGRPVTHEAGGKVTDGGTRTSAVVVCPSKHGKPEHRWQIVVELLPIRTMQDEELPL